MSKKKYYKRKTDVAIGLSDEEVYLLVRSGTLARFPKNFLNKDVCKRIFRYLCLEMHQFTREDVCKLRTEFLISNFIRDFALYFNLGYSELIVYSFPEWDIKYWELQKTPSRFWDDKENQKAFVEWVAQKENLDLNKQEDVSKMDTRLFNSYGGGIARICAGGTYELICTATQDRFQEWEVVKVHVWTDEKVVKAVKWLIEEKLKWSDEQVMTSLRATTFMENNLYGLITNYRFGGSPSKVLDFAYPGKFKNVKSSNV